ncbi:MAG: DUF2799 domain-containing protein [Amphritea sp.]
MAGVLSGCATLDREECLNADWHLIGYEDGSAGRLPEQVGEHRQACAEYAVVPDMDAYLQGRSQGLVNYCTEENGYAWVVKALALTRFVPAKARPTLCRATVRGKSYINSSSWLNV